MNDLVFKIIMYSVSVLIWFTCAERDDEIGPSWSQSSRTSGGDKKSEGESHTAEDALAQRKCANRFFNASAISQWRKY